MTDVEKPIVYIIGHKTPDTDSICAAIAYAYLKNKIEPDKEFKAMRAGPVNEETEFVLQRFGAEAPPLLEDATGKTVILLDHNEKAQAVDNIDKAKILEIVDHHETDNLGKEKADIFHQELIGSTSTIIADKFLEAGAEIPKQTAELLLSAILSDTVIFRSVTTRQKDKDIAAKLSEITGIDNLEEFGIEIKKAKVDISGKTINEILYSDFKDFDLSGNKVGVGQVEVIDLQGAQTRKKELLDKMKEILKEKQYYMLLFMITDIIKEGTDLLVVGEDSEKVIQDVFNHKLEENSVYLKGIMSRKRQLTEPLRKYFVK